MEVVVSQDVKNVLKFAITLGESFEKAEADKKVDLADLGLLMAPLMQVGPALESLKVVGPALKSMVKDQAQMAATVAWAKEELELDHKKVEIVIEAALDLALSVGAFVALVKEK